MGSTNDGDNNIPPPPDHNDVSDAVMEVLLEFQVCFL
jgi:hypothetical protein